MPAAVVGQHDHAAFAQRHQTLTGHHHAGQHCLCCPWGHGRRLAEQPRHGCRSERYRGRGQSRGQQHLQTQAQPHQQQPATGYVDAFIVIVIHTGHLIRFIVQAKYSL